MSRRRKLAETEIQTFWFAFLNTDGDMNAIGIVADSLGSAAHAFKGTHTGLYGFGYTPDAAEENLQRALGGARD